MAERGWIRELVRAVVWAVVVGVAVAVVQVVAGEKDPLRILVPALVVFFVVAILLELWPRYRLGDRLRNAFAWLAARSPVTVSIRIERRRRVSLPEGERGLWDFRRDGDRALKRLNDVLVEIGNEMKRANKKAVRNAQRMGKAAAGGADVEQAYSLGKKTAKDINAHAAKMEKLERRFRTERVSMVENYTDWRREQPSDADLRLWKTQLRQMRQASQGARKGVESYRGSVTRLRSQKISQPVNQATDRLAAVLTKHIENIKATEDFCRDVGK